MTAIVIYTILATLGYIGCGIVTVKITSLFDDYLIDRRDPDTFILGIMVLVWPFFFAIGVMAGIVYGAGALGKLIARL
jgi:hypothetical protein